MAIAPSRSLPGLALFMASTVALSCLAFPWGPRGAGHHHHQKQQQRYPLLIVIFDGFRHDYLELYRARGLRLANFEAFEQAGVRAMQVKNVYPTETLPNHQSLVTGLYAESHGFILNVFKDPQVPGVFSIYQQDTLNDANWSRGWPEPLWVTNQRQGGRSAVVLYPNSDVPFNGVLPFVQVDQYAILNNGTDVRYPYARRVDHILRWLAEPTLYNINLALLYFDEPDHTGHLAGHLSDQVAQRLLELDGYLGQLLGGLRELGLLDLVNIVLTADHGMATGNASNMIDLDRILNPDWYDNLLSDKDDIHLYIAPKPGRAVDILRAVAASGQPALHASLGQDLPAWMHLNGSRRTPPIYLWADMPYLIVVGGLPLNPPARYGVHGYANNLTDMWPLWMARGPAFLSGGARVSGLIESVDLYPLACKLLGIQGNPSNGSLARISPVLAPERADPAIIVRPSASFRTYASAAAALGVVCLAVLVVVLMARLGKVARAPGAGAAAAASASAAKAAAASRGGGKRRGYKKLVNSDDEPQH